MVARKGILRIVEASIAIVVILGFLLVTQVSIRQVEEPDFSGKIYDLLEEISRNSNYRDDVFNADLSNGKSKISEGVLYDFVSQEIESYLNFEIRVCQEIDKICSLEEFVGEVYSGNRVIVPDVDNPGLEPRKLAIFIWRAG